MDTPEETWGVDSEWGFRDGRVGEESAWEPVVFCAVGLRSGRRLSFPRHDGRLHTFFQQHKGDLFVSHNAISEMKYLLRLGVPVPSKWFDTDNGWRWLKNRPGHQHESLLHCLHAIGQPHLAPEVKGELRDAILHLRFDQNSPDEWRRIITYCFSDCDAVAVLYAYLRSRVPAWWMELLAHYLLAISRMELRGVVLDLVAYDRLQDAAPSLLAALRKKVNHTHPVYDGGTFKNKEFFAWLERAGIEWPLSISPTTRKPYRSLKDDVLKEMELRHPFIQLVRDVRKTHKHLGKRTMVVDRATGKHHFDTNVLGSVTGRNQPRGGFIFGGPKYQRSLILPESPDHVSVYLDARGQEIGIAAAKTGDAAMRAVYETDDAHMTTAVWAGAAPPGATEKTHPRERKMYKVAGLGLLYWETAFGLSHRLGISFAAAEKLVADHRRLFAQFWRLSERWVQRAYDDGFIHTALGWRSRVPLRSNERTWANWPIQAAGADVMRLVVAYLDRQGVRILAPVHDGFLLSCRRDQLADLHAAVDFATQTASQQALGGFPLRWKTEVFDGHFIDEDGQKMWDYLQAQLRGAGRAVAIA
jgi:hypothetical protein